MRPVVRNLQRLHVRFLTIGTLGAVTAGTLFESFIPGVEPRASSACWPTRSRLTSRCRWSPRATSPTSPSAELLQPEPEPFAIREVLGPRDLTHPDVAAAFGLPYTALPYDEMAAALVGAGLSDDVARHH